MLMTGMIPHTANPYVIKNILIFLFLPLRFIVNSHLGIHTHRNRFLRYEFIKINMKVVYDFIPYVHSL